MNERKTVVRCRWTEQDVRELERLAEQRAGAKQIAKQLDRSENAVKLNAYWLDLSLDMETEAGL